MQISPRELLDPLVRVILQFHQKDTTNHNNYRIFKSLKDAKIADCICQQTNDLSVPFQIKWYDKQADELGIFASKAKGTPSAETNADKQTAKQSGNTPRKTTSEFELKYAQVSLPISQALYNKINKIPFIKYPCLTVEELYALITSNLFSVLDNRLSIVQLIVDHFHTDHKMYEEMCIHHCKKTYSLLNKVCGFEIDEIRFMELVYTEQGLEKLEEMLSDLKRPDSSAVQRKAILNARLCLYHWSNSFLNFINATKKNIGFIITDLRGQNAHVLSINNTQSQPVLIMSIDRLDLCYMFNRLSMDYHFLQFNEQLLMEQFENADVKPSIMLGITFKRIETENMEDLCEVVNRLLRCRFVCEDHVIQLFLRFDNLDIKLETTQIGDKKCNICLNNSGLMLLNSLPTQTISLEMQNMLLTETVKLCRSLNVLKCRNVVVSDGCKIIIVESCATVKLISVNSLIEYSAFGTVKSFESSIIKSEWLATGKFSRFKMLCIWCTSDFTCNENIKTLVLDWVNVSPPFIMRFNGECHRILLNHCTGTIDLRHVSGVVDILECTECLPKNFFKMLPLLVQDLVITELEINYDVKVERKVHSIELKKVNVREEHTFKLDGVYHTVRIRESQGTFNLFGQLLLTMSFDGITLPDLIFQRKNNDNEIDFFLISSTVMNNNMFFNTLNNIYLVNVHFMEPISLHLDDDINVFFVINFVGTIRLTGIISGTFFHREFFRSELTIIKMPSKQTYKIIFIGIEMQDTVFIRCKLESISLKNIQDDILHSICVMNSCDFIMLENYTGSVDMLSSPYLRMSSVTNVSLVYSEHTNSFTTSGELYLSTHYLPDNIVHIDLKELVMVTSCVFHLHSNLKSIKIINCSGTFHFAGMLNVNELVVERRNMIRMKTLSTQDVRLNLQNLSFNGSLNVSGHVRELNFNNVILGGEAVVSIDSQCKLVRIIHSQCTIHWLNAMGHDAMVCTVDGSYKFKKNVDNGMLSFDLSNTLLAEQINISNNVEEICLNGVRGSHDTPVMVNRSCKSLLLKNSTGLVMCHSLECLDVFTVVRPIASPFEVKFSNSNGIRFQICYAFENGLSVQIVICTKNLRSISSRSCCSNITVKEIMDDNTCQPFDLHLTAFQRFSNGIECTYDMDIAEIDLIAVLKGHLRNDEAQCQALGMHHIMQITISYLARN